MASDKISVKEFRAFFEDGSREVKTGELLALKKAPGVQYDTAYDDLARGIEDGSLNYLSAEERAKAA